MEVIELVYRANKPLFTGLLYKCLRDYAFLSTWKKADLVLCNKIDKERSDASSYHPICLLTAGSKMLDKLVTNRQVFHVRSRVFLHPNQFGFTPGKSTEHALHEVRKTAEDCHARDKDTFLIMLDVKGAFNKLSWPEIYAQLRRIGCAKNIYRLVISFRSNRSKVVEQLSCS